MSLKRFISGILIHNVPAFTGYIFTRSSKQNSVDWRIDGWQGDESKSLRLAEQYLNDASKMIGRIERERERE